MMREPFVRKRKQNRALSINSPRNSSILQLHHHSLFIFFSLFPFLFFSLALSLSLSLSLSLLLNPQLELFSVPAPRPVFHGQASIAIMPYLLTQSGIFFSSRPSYLSLFRQPLFVFFPPFNTMDFVTQMYLSDILQEFWNWGTRKESVRTKNSIS